MEEIEREIENEDSLGDSPTDIIGLLPAGSIQSHRDHIEEGPLSRPSSLSSARKLLFGLVIVFTIACSWVGSTQTSKSAFTDHDFKAPFFSMWFGTAWMITLFPMSVPLYFLTQKRSLKDLWRLVLVSTLIPVQYSLR